MTVKNVWLSPTPRDGFSEIGMTGLSLEQLLQLARAKHASLTLLGHRYELFATVARRDSRLCKSNGAGGAGAIVDETAM